MASNLSGMMQQLNQALAANPLAKGGVGDNLLAGGLMQMGNAAGAAMGREPTSFMGLQQSKQMHADAELSKLDLSTVEGKAKAAEIYTKTGQVDKAMEMQREAEAQQKAISAKEHAVLDAANAGIQQEAQSKRTMVQKRQAMGLASTNGRPDLARAIQAGTLEPEGYMEKVMADEELHKLSQGSMLVDKEGNIIRFNPKLPAGGPGNDISVYDNKKYDELTIAAGNSKAFANKAAGLIEQLGQTEYKSGAYATAEDAILTFMGKRDEPQYLRTMVTSMRNHEAIGMLPKGPASDRDVAIVFQGVPPANAGKEEITEFLAALERVSRRQAQYDQMMADYIIRGKRIDFQKDWDSLMAQEAYQEKVQATPAAAVAHMQENMDDKNTRDWFLYTYEWLPDEE